LVENIIGLGPPSRQVNSYLCSQDTNASPPIPADADGSIGLPDVVITVMTERFLIRSRDDSHAPSLLELETEKRASGALLPPKSVVL